MPNSEDIETFLDSIYHPEFGDAKRLVKVILHPVLTWSAFRYARGESVDSSCPSSNFRHHFICIGKVRRSKISERERTKHEPLATRSERLNQLRSPVSLHKCLEVEDGMRTT